MPYKHFLAAVILICPAILPAQSLDEIVVTTRKIEENLQDVPVAITAFNSKVIDEARIENLGDVASLTPGLNFFNPFGDNLPVPVIRGVAPTDIFGEPNAAVYVDGVFAAGREGLNFSLLDIERIEVSKGRKARYMDAMHSAARLTMSLNDRPKNSRRGSKSPAATTIVSRPRAA